MLDLHRLRLLREVYLRGSLAAAATALRYSPSAVSQQLAVLEREVGTPLLEKVGRGVRLTAQAQILVGHAEVVLERLELAEAEVAASLSDVTGTVRVACFQTVALSLMPTMLDHVRRAYPGLRVELSQVDPDVSMPALQARDYDLAVAEEFPGQPQPLLTGLDREEVGPDPLRLALPPALAHRDITDLAQLADQPWIVEPPTKPARRWVTTLCRAAGFEPDILHESADMLLNARLVETGHGVALLPDLVWQGSSPPVAVRDLPGGRVYRQIYTAARVGSGHHPAITAVRAALRAAHAAGTTPAPG
ncbi:LysR family transcriptional regulator [Cryptosporangium minutisporangium]|uniref:LysR substrate-binding domain-containing protein n=1 Tax=Cryptosporangium minutisporangium TaxID=113569 RepID=A0ABP6T3D5_9ACTN